MRTKPNIKYAPAFAKVFNDKEVFLHFLNSVKPKQLSDFMHADFLPAPSEPYLTYNREDGVAAICKNKENETFIVEIRPPNSGSVHKAHVEAAKLCCLQRNSSGDHPKPHPIIVINISECVLLDGVDFLSYHGLINIENPSHRLSQDLYVFLELPKFFDDTSEIFNRDRRIKRKQRGKSVENWCRLLRYGEIEADTDLPEPIMKALNILNTEKWTDIEMQLYKLNVLSKQKEVSIFLQAQSNSLKSGIEYGLLAGLNQGFSLAKKEEKPKQPAQEIRKKLKKRAAEAEESARMEVADKLLKNGMAIETVCEVTSLELEVLKSLKKKKIG